MKRKINTFLRRAISLVILFAMLGFVGNKIVFTHVHVTENGKLIAHAHPFSKSADKSPVKSHKHSINDYAFLDHLDILFVYLAVGLTALVVLVRYRRITTDTDLVFQDTANWKPTRAPPTFDLI